jgi:hypothetical protein
LADGQHGTIKVPIALHCLIYFNTRGIKNIGGTNKPLTPCQSNQIIEFNWGLHEVDWFASDHNFKLKVVYSRYWNMYSTGIDVFTLDWHGVNGLFVPFYHLKNR